MGILDNWIIYVIIYLIASIAFTQFYKIATKTMTKTGALTVLLEFIAGLFGLISGLIIGLCSGFRFPADIKIYILLGLSIICYAIKDRLDTKVMSGVESSTFNILQQLSTTFMIFAGLIFLKEQFVLTKFIGAMLIIVSNVFVFYRRGKFEFNKYIILGIIANLLFTVALFLDVNISENFLLPIYSAMTLMIPAFLIKIFERIKIEDIKNEFKNGNKKAIIITGIAWPIDIIANLKAYQLGNVSTVAPLCALTVILNVIFGYIFLKEKDNLVKKIIAALLIVVSIFLIKI